MIRNRSDGQTSHWKSISTRQHGEGWCRMRFRSKLDVVAARAARRPVARQGLRARAAMAAAASTAMVALLAAANAHATVTISVTTNGDDAASASASVGTCRKLCSNA